MNVSQLHMKWRFVPGSHSDSEVRVNFRKHLVLPTNCSLPSRLAKSSKEIQLHQFIVYTNIMKAVMIVKPQQHVTEFLKENVIVSNGNKPRICWA